MARSLLSVILVLTVLILASGCCIQRVLKICGGVQGIQCEEGYACEIDDVSVTDAFGRCVPQPPETTETTMDSQSNTCKIDETYVESSTKHAGCSCPQGYAFDSNIIGYSHEGGVESPILEVRCVPA